MKPKITICIPSHNNENVIADAIKSCLIQEYPLKEILVCDDASNDSTVLVARTFPEVRLIINNVNIGIGENLVKLMEEAQGKYVVYLCADDIFTHPKVLTDIVNQFDKGNQDIGVIGRFGYYFYHGYKGAIGVLRDKNILTQSCCPSGMAFRRDDNIFATNKIFIEMPYIVEQYLRRWRWTMFEYDTVAFRYHPGGNTGTKKSYYQGSCWQNWVDLTGNNNWKDYPSFIMLKNRAPHKLWEEICLAVKINKNCLKDASFWFYSLISIIVPSWILKKLSNFYRLRILRGRFKVIERGNNV